MLFILHRRTTRCGTSARRTDRKNVCRELIVLCRSWGLFTEATVAIDFAGEPANEGGIAQRAKVVFNQRHEGRDQ